MYTIWMKLLSTHAPSGRDTLYQTWFWSGEYTLLSLLKHFLLHDYKMKIINLYSLYYFFMTDKINSRLNDYILLKPIDCTGLVLRQFYDVIALLLVF